jgi:hypothetical protein
MNRRSYSVKRKIPLRRTFSKALGDPDLDDRLASDPQSLGLTIERIDHPHGEIDVDSPLLFLGTPGFAEFKVICQVLSPFKLPFKLLRLHTSEPPPDGHGVPR